MSHGGGFEPTRWSLVLRAQGGTPEARAALSELCEAYWEPVFRFLQREGRDEDAARELTQEFFARLLARSGVDAADPERGRFRSYLLGALRHFLGDLRVRAAAKKRGAGLEVPWADRIGVEAHETDGEGSPEPEASAVESPGWERRFDLQWALAVMDRGLRGLQAEWETAGKGPQFAVLKGWLGGEPPTSQADAGRALGLSEGAVKVLVHRLRKRFGDRVRSELAQTLPEGTDPAEELRYLVEVLSNRG